MEINIPEINKIKDNVSVLHAFTKNHYTDDDVISKFLEIKQQINSVYILETETQVNWAHETFYKPSKLKPLFEEYGKNSFVNNNIILLSMLFFDYELEVEIGELSSSKHQEKH